MIQLDILKRHLAILRAVQPPFVYPSKTSILNRLREESLDSVSAWTFERDIKEIETYYGISINYSHQYRGYFLNQPEDEDISSFKQFFQLLERSERLAFLTHSSDALRTSKYLASSWKKLTVYTVNPTLSWQVLLNPATSLHLIPGIANTGFDCFCTAGCTLNLLNRTIPS